MGVKRSIGKAAVALYLVLLHLFAGFLAVRYFYPDFRPFANQPVAAITDPTAATPAPTPIPVPSQFVEDLPPDQPIEQSTPSPLLPDAPADKLMIPVRGIKRTQLQD